MNSLYIVASLIVLFLFFFVLIWWRLPRWQLDHLYPDITKAKDRADAEDAFRKTLSQVFSGLLLLVSLWLTLQQLLDVRWTTSQQLLSSQAQQHADQFSRALDRMSSPSLSSQIGGVYSLEAIAQIDPKYHSIMVEVLSEEIRSRLTSHIDLDPVIHAALISLGRRDTKLDVRLPDLQKANLEAFLLNGAKLHRLNLNWANFKRATLKEADFEGSLLSKADFSAGNLEGIHAIRVKFVGAIFRAANDRVANLSRGDFSGADMAHADLRGAYLRDAKFIGANLRFAQLADADVAGADFSKARLESALGLSSEQVATMKCDAATKLPVGLSSEECNSSMHR